MAPPARAGPYLWAFPERVALALLVAAKLATVTLPIVLKRIVDSLDASQQEVVVLPLAMLVAYGALRLTTVLFSELRDLVFGRVTEHAMRRLALRAFDQLHGLNLDLHLARRTGGLSRDIERGSHERLLAANGRYAAMWRLQREGEGGGDSAAMPAETARHD